MQLTYTAYTDTENGFIFRFGGSVQAARQKAIKYAREAFPAWNYKGFGPVILVRDATTNDVLHYERL